MGIEFEGKKPEDGLLVLYWGTAKRRSDYHASMIIEIDSSL